MHVEFISLYHKIYMKYWYIWKKKKKHIANIK